MIILLKNIQYITREGKEFYCLMEKYPEKLDEKMKLLSCFRRYMSGYIVKASATVLIIFLRNIQYITWEGKKFYCLMEKYPEKLDEKMKLLSCFRRYMSGYIVKASATVHVQKFSYD